MEKPRGNDREKAAERSRIGGLIVLLFVAAPLLCARIADLPLLDPNEAKHAQAAREMLEAGRWIEPVVYGQPYHHKPSLLYVMIGLCYRLLGVGEAAARVVSVAAGLVTLAALYWEASRRTLAQGWLAALLLASSTLFWAVARFTSFDALLTCVTFVAAIALSRWCEGDGRGGRAIVLAGVFAALAVLVKGPAGVVLLAVPALVCGKRAFKNASSASLWIAVLAFVAVVATWFLPAAVFHPRYVLDFLWVHNVQRFSVDADVFHPEPFWFFLPVLLVTLLPWSPFVPAAIAAAWKRDPGDRFFAVYALWVIGFFSLSNGKLATYVLPAYPVLAMLVARWIAEESTRLPSRASSLTCRAVGFVYAISPMTAYAIVRAEEPGFEHLAWVLTPLAMAGAAVLFLRRGTPAFARRAVTALCVGTLVSFVVALVWLAPAVGRLSSNRDLVAELKQRSAPPDVVVVHKVRPFSFLFYSRWPLVYKVPEDEYRAALMMPGRVWVLTKDSRLATFPYGDPPLRLREIARNHRHVVLERVDDPHAR